MPANADTWTYRLVRERSREAQRRRLKESNDSHLGTKATPKDSSNGRDSRFGLARPVQVFKRTQCISSPGMT
jgi:hypothetical protein